MAKKISFGLSAREIKSAQKQLRDYQKEITRKCEELAHRLADEGVILAKVKLTQFPAIDSGELLNSIMDEPGAVLTNGARWIIYTGCDHAAYIEFGFGLRGEQNPHPDPSISNWKYDIHGHGSAGWWYYKNGDWHWSGGQPSKPFMFETGRDLRNLVPKLAKEVFGSA
ncbi:hypothetical protein C3B58_14595 [Lactonifactor longoviformis]|uniref:Uncharacterized protein n=1 Tax=Lactonifactor longoviformis DSM 17459 TaxID=1122155 RepID=A0A1M5D7F1_9CLOT|nr:HK97 gp10 family phage protein [Lactonifactor longoviformis]POP31853.1 hypothetical protein C3B58_14595 [Lactonifactor longoviformis]SHF62979.1 hypothetical protein SAMN02745158_04443 [Lactonifactor longoviformis DSM 17459]